MASRSRVVLKPGDFHFTTTEALIYTLLGSCVSITMWHPKHHFGGACHYMLPTRGGVRSAGRLDGRYADEAIQLFLDEMGKHLTSPREYEVKMFGGGNQFPDSAGPSALDVSRNNVAAGLRLLKQHGFVLMSKHLGGTGYRRMEFDLATGDVRVIHVNQPPPQDVP